jgi:hypothetical protein
MPEKQMQGMYPEGRQLTLSDSCDPWSIFSDTAEAGGKERRLVLTLTISRARICTV